MAIVGRPNAGKSTLFNRLVRKRAAIVHDTPGVTRDRNVALGLWDDRELVFIDTGGLDMDARGGIDALVRRQSQGAIAEADVVVFVFDGRAGLSPIDRDAVDVLRRSAKPVVYAVNKIDTAKQRDSLYEFARLGTEPPIAVSAEHNRGVAELMRAVLAAVPPDIGESEGRAAHGTRLALVGRPNVGKSSLLNRLAGSERSIVHATPGTTRDPVDTPVSLGNRPYILVDTAGIRRRSRIGAGVERLTVVRAFSAIGRAEIVLLVLDAVEGMTDQDARIAAYAWERGRAMAFLVNKWDLVEAPEVTERAWVADQRDKHPAFSGIPALCVSAETGWHVDRLPALFRALEDDFCAELPTARLNQVLRAAVQNHGPPLVRGRAPRLLYAAQVATRPPSVAVFTSDPDRIQTSYVRYLRARFAEAFGIRGAPVRLEFRRRRDSAKGRRGHPLNARGDDRRPA